MEPRDGRSENGERERPESPGRPWWGNPLVWLAVAAVFLLLGVFVAPHYLGGTVILLPFLWIWRPRGRRYT